MRVPSLYTRAPGAPGGVSEARSGWTRRDFLRASLQGAALTALSPPLACSRAPRAPRPSVLLVTLDTTRCDRLGCYGYGAPTSPALDRLAQDATVYERAYAPSSWTLPSHASLFTGKFARSHGARKDPNGPLHVGQAIEGDPRLARLRARGLDPDQPTLAELARAVGYRCGGIVGGPWLKALFGLGRGFEHWDDTEISSENGRPAASVSDAALRWLDADDGRPFLLFLNYFDAHTPYRPPAATLAAVHPGAGVTFETAKTLEDLGALYDGELRVADDGFAHVLDALRARGLYDGMMILVTSDHGELLGEHGAFGHGKSLWEPEVHIPLLVKWPRGETRAGRDDQLVQLPDLLPLLAQRVGLPLPPDVQGAWPPRREGAYAEVSPLPHESPTGPWRMWIEGRHKILSIERAPQGVFDLKSDPGEMLNLSEVDTTLATRLRGRLDAFAAALPVRANVAAEATHEIDAETQRALRDLGYAE